MVILRMLIFILVLIGTPNLHAQITNNPATHKPMEKQYYLKDTVKLTGTLRTGRYLSRTTNSDKENFNEAYLLYLENGITIIDAENKENTYEDIQIIEIADPYFSNLYNCEGKKVELKGILDVFQSSEGYYRQYSTPVYIRVVSFKIIDEK